MVHELAHATHAPPRWASPRAPDNNALVRARHFIVVLLAALGVAGALTFGARAIGLRTQRLEPTPPPPVARAAPPPDGVRVASFIAFARDFRDFRSWERHGVTGAMMPIGAADGPTFIYVNRRAPEGSRRWPIGSIVVKAIESGAPESWTIHAMVKRGVPFNRDGAVGWEYFELRFDPERDAPRIVWRGGGPPSGHGYAAQGRAPDAGAIPLVCDDCHAPAWQNDSVLTPALALR